MTTATVGPAHHLAVNLDDTTGPDKRANVLCEKSRKRQLPRASLMQGEQTPPKNTWLGTEVKIRTVLARHLHENVRNRGASWATPQTKETWVCVGPSPPPTLGETRCTNTTSYKASTVISSPRAARAGLSKTQLFESKAEVQTRLRT